MTLRLDTLPLERKATLYEYCENGGALRLKIDVSGWLPTNIESQGIRHAVYEAVNSILEELKAERLAQDPHELARAELEKTELIGLFGNTPIFVEPIPNGYEKAYHTRLRPWFVVTVPVGRFTIGWRRRVIQIDWNQTIGTKTYAELFPGEGVTHEARMIHAHTVEDARRYIRKIVESAGIP